jgi:hypothetical protein
MKNEIEKTLISNQSLVEALGKSYEAGYFYAVSAIKSAILATGKTQTVISVEMMDEMVSESKKQLEAMK